MAEQVNTGTTQPTATAPEGHDEAMLAKVDQKEAELAGLNKGTEETAEEELIGGKFKSQEDLLKAYRELEKKLSKPDAAAEETKEATEELQKEAEAAAESAGLDLSALEHFYAENGSLSDEHYAALEKAGIARNVVDQYIAGQEAVAERLRSELMASVGGEEQFQSIITWAAANLAKDDLVAYNKAVDSNDPAVVRAAVQGLAYQYTNRVGKEPNLVQGGGGGKGGGFESVAQLTAAMRDPRYANDPAYRREVEERLSRSNIM